MHRHRLARRHALAVHHAHLVHAREVRAATRLRASHGYGADWWSTNTPDWWCIRVREEGGQAAPGNMFGFVPFSGGTDAQQRAEALSILHTAGWGAWSTAPGCGL